MDERPIHCSYDGKCAAQRKRVGELLCSVGDAAVPFGGYGLSGYGKEKGFAGIAEYLNSKTVWIRTD